jgi:hypothetical protein
MAVVAMAVVQGGSIVAIIGRYLGISSAVALLSTRSSSNAAGIIEVAFATLRLGNPPHPLGAS